MRCLPRGTADSMPKLQRPHPDSQSASRHRLHSSRTRVAPYLGYLPASRPIRGLTVHPALCRHCSTVVQRRRANGLFPLTRRFDPVGSSVLTVDGDLHAATTATPAHGFVGGEFGVGIGVHSRLGHVVAYQAALGADAVNPAVPFGSTDRADATMPVVMFRPGQAAAGAAAIVPIVVLVPHRAAPFTATAVPVMEEETG